MPFVKVGADNSVDIEIHYDDHGSGAPVVLIHGYPLNGNFVGASGAGAAGGGLSLHQL